MPTLIFADHGQVYLVECEQVLDGRSTTILEWLLGARRVSDHSIAGPFIGPRREMVTPWSTNATEIARNVGLTEIRRIECFRHATSDDHDPMLEQYYPQLGADTFKIDASRAPVLAVENIAAFNHEAGLALSGEEIRYLEEVSGRLGRSLTDAELFGFGQINSEHCRHKVFRGTFILEGEEQPESLFGMIRRTSELAPRQLVSAYQDNVAFFCGPDVLEFAPERADVPSFFRLRSIGTILSLKAETHNFPTTVEPFNGAATGSGGEIRDRMAGGTGSIPLAGSAVYMTAYPRLESGRPWEEQNAPRAWKYQSPEQILIKASNGASDFGNKFGQPLILGSLSTFEMNTPQGLFGYDRTIMLAGGVGYANRRHAFKKPVKAGDQVILLGGDNYRIGMAGGSVSSVDTGNYSQSLELSAVQRANPEMQKRVFNVIRALVEMPENPVKSIHDHGAGGHMNCFAELLEEQGGRIFIDRLPVGDPTLSVRELLSNESQERMGLIVAPEHVDLMRQIAERERAPMYVIGEVTGSKRLEFVASDGSTPVALPMEVLFGSSPKTVVRDNLERIRPQPVPTLPANGSELLRALRQLFSLEGVACKDWLTNKVDRSVTGKVAQQQCVGPRQLPLADYGIAALSYTSTEGVCTSLGHAAAAGLLDERAGSVLSIAEALTNIVFAPLEKGLESVVLSANWMWPAKNPGEDARLYSAVAACSDFAVSLGLSIPTGKDSLSMTMKYDDRSVRAPGTVVITAAAQTLDFTKRVTPDLKNVPSALVAVDFSGVEGWPLGGSSYAQTLGVLGDRPPTVADPKLFKHAFNAVQDLLAEGSVLAGHDVSAGGLITAVAEMCFGGSIGVELYLEGSTPDVASRLFSEKPSVVLQIAEERVESVCRYFENRGISSTILGRVGGKIIALRSGALTFETDLDELLHVWFHPSQLLDQHQSKLADERSLTVCERDLQFRFPSHFSGMLKEVDICRQKPSGVRAAIVREKGTNGDREMAFSLFAAGFDVRDVTISDLVSGREDLRDVQFVVFPGGFSNSDVLGAGRGWAAVCRYNERALRVVRDYFARTDTLSLGVCNGCQFVSALELLYPEHERKIEMRRNASEKFESAFLAVTVHKTNNVLLQGLEGACLGIWVAHGEGRFYLPQGEAAYDIPLRYVSSRYPLNPNGSDFNAAGVSSGDGRHLIMMPHLERSIFPWQWGYYPSERCGMDRVTPWLNVFINARRWIEGVR